MNEDWQLRKGKINYLSKYIDQRVKEARRTLPSLLYVPEIMAWWDLVDEPARVVFTSLMSGLDNSVAMLVLTTATCAPSELPNEVIHLRIHTLLSSYSITFQ